MKKKIIASIVAALLSSSALADTSSMNGSVAGMGILQNEWVKAGINGTTGTLGSGNATSPGLLFDPTGTGTFNPSYDYLTPGSPFDGFSVKVDGTNYFNNNAGNAANIANDGNGLTDGTNTLSWTGGVTGVFDITNSYTLAPNTPYIDITSRITMGVSATTLSFGKYIDPDSQGMPGDSSSTDNVLGYGVIPTTNVAFSEATTSRYALGIYTTDTNVTAGVEGWTREADGYNGTNYTDSDGNPVNYGNSDDTIGISWTWTGISAGDILTANYAYIFGPSAFDAANDAINGGAGGGADVSGWGTLTDVGSATDAASGGGSVTPTITGTTTNTVNGAWSSWTINSTLPVLTAGITHHEATDDGKVQTIDRETTTTITTPEYRNRTVSVIQTDTYSDSSTVDTVLSTSTESEGRSVSVTSVTNPGSFVGRIDQMATADNMLSMANRRLSFDGINFVGDRASMKNGMSGGVTGLTVGGTKELDNGWSIGGGVGKLSTRVRDIGTADVDTTLVNLHGGRKIEQGNIAVSLTHSMNDYTGSRTIGDFANSSKTSGTDTWANVTFTGNGEKIRPVLGVTHGVRTVNGYAESGSIQSARTVAGSSDHYTFGTIGAQATLIQGVNVQALHHTDGVNSLGLLVNREIQKDTTVSLAASRNMSGKGSANAITIGFVKKF